MEAHVILRRYHEQDWPEWEYINKRLGFFQADIDTEEQLRSLSHENNQNHIPLVALVESEIVGVSAVSILGRWAHVWRIGILPKWQRTGLGTQLLHEVECFISSQGCTTYQLLSLPELARWYVNQGLNRKTELVLLTKEVCRVDP